MFNIIKVPKHITVRIVTPQPENALLFPKSELKRTESRENMLYKLIKKAVSSTGVGIFLGIGVYYILKFSGMSFSGLETSILVLTPSLLGLLASYIIL